MPHRPPLCPWYGPRPRGRAGGRRTTQASGQRQQRALWEARRVGHCLKTCLCAAVHMTVYVLVVALVSATGGMLFGFGGLPAGAGQSRIRTQCLGPNSAGVMKDSRQWWAVGSSGTAHHTLAFLTAPPVLLAHCLQTSALWAVLR